MPNLNADSRRQFSSSQQVDIRPLDELTANAINSAQRAFNLEIANISRASLAQNGLDPADGWRLNLQPDTPGYRSFIRLKVKDDETTDLPKGAVALVAENAAPAVDE